MTRDVIPPRPAGPDRHPASASAGEAGSATSPKKWTSIFVFWSFKNEERTRKKNKNAIFVFVFDVPILVHLRIFLIYEYLEDAIRSKNTYIHSRRHSLILNGMKYSIICTLKPLRVANILKYRIRRLQKKYFITSLGQILK